LVQGVGHVGAQKKPRRPAGRRQKELGNGLILFEHRRGAMLNRSCAAHASSLRRLRGRRHRRETCENRGSRGGTEKPRVGAWAQEAVPRETGFLRVAADVPSAAQAPGPFYRIAHPRHGRAMAVFCASQSISSRGACTCEDVSGNALVTWLSLWQQAQIPDGRFAGA
jgi:hypothetical protein